MGLRPLDPPAGAAAWDITSRPVSRSRRPPRPARGRMIRVRVSDEEYAALAEKGAAVGGMSKLLRDHLGKICDTAPGRRAAAAGDAQPHQCQPEHD